MRLLLLVVLLSLFTLPACADQHEPSSHQSPAQATIVASPVRSPKPPDVLAVSCGRGAIEMDHHAVPATPRGVHVSVTNESTRPLFFQFYARPDGPFGGIEVRPGSSDLAVQLPPGEASLRCSDGDGAVSDEFVIEIFDPSASFTSYYLSCPGGELTPPVSPWATLDAGLPDPITTVRDVVIGLRGTDALEVVGYPLTPHPAVGLIRDGDVVATFNLEPRANEWAVYYAACAGSDITVAE